MQNGNAFANPGAAPSFTGLDDASALPPELGEGKSIVEIEKCEAFDGQFGLTFSAFVKVISSTNPENVPGKTYRWKRGGLTKSPYSDGNMRRLRQFLAAALDTDPSVEEPQPGVKWSDLAKAAVTEEAEKGAGEGTALQGHRVLLDGTWVAPQGDKKGYVKWNSVRPAPAA